MIVRAHLCLLQAAIRCELSQLDDNGYGKRRWIVVQEFGPYTNHLSDREQR
jgi:hypothetical protein